MTDNEYKKINIVIVNLEKLRAEVLKVLNKETARGKSAFNKNQAERYYKTQAIAGALDDAYSFITDAMNSLSCITNKEE